MARPIRAKLLRELTLLGAVAIPLLAVLSWFGLLHVLRLQADRRMSEDLRLLDARIAERLQRVEQASSALGLLWCEGVLDPARPDQARLLLSTQLDHAPGPASIMLVRRDGLGFFSWSRNGVQSSAAIRPLDAERSILERSRVDRKGRPTQPIESETLPYNPLRRPWIDAAVRNPDPAWTEPYLFASYPAVPRDRGLGMTYATQVRTRAGEPLGYLGIDVSLDDLSEMAAAVRPTPSSDVMVLDGQNRVLASSTRGPSPFYLKPADSGDFPLVQAVLSQVVASGSAESQEVRFRNRTWFGRAHPLAAMSAQGWRVTVAIPESELIGSARWQLAALFAALAALILAVALRLGLLAQRLGGSLGELAAAAHGVGKTPHLELPPEGSIEELNDLRSALERSHLALREQQRLSDQLTHSQRVALVGFLAGGLAHDINNQLGTVLAGISEGRAAVDPKGPAAQPLEEAERACWRSAEAMRGLLGLSRRGAPAFRAVEVNAVVLETGRLLERLFDRRVKLELATAPELPVVSADPIQLEQVLLNLAINARDAMPKGGVLRIETIAREDGIRIEVADTGVGIPEQIRARIFEPFFTTKGDGQGTGLGLAMVASIVRGHGGEVSVESEPGRTVFRLDLPLEPPGEVAAG